jgi:hypothetical protein
MDMVTIKGRLLAVSAIRQRNPPAVQFVQFVQRAAVYANLR